MLWLGTFVIGILLTLGAQWKVKTTFHRWSQVPASRGMTGAEVARNILDRNGLRSVQVEPIAGQLSDHYDPVSRVVRLSEAVYNVRSVAAIAVAAHECGHALQHQENYGALVFRHRMIPVLNFTSGMAPWFLLAGFFFHYTGLLVLGVLFFAVAVLFHLVTLPVEFNASSRAKKIMWQAGWVDREEYQGVRKVLSAAAFTYVAAALVALFELLRYIFILVMQNREE